MFKVITVAGLITGAVLLIAGVKLYFETMELWSDREEEE